MYNSRIEWCDSTWNPITGCFHECEYCYARTMARRYARDERWTPINDRENEKVTISGKICEFGVVHNPLDVKGISPYPYGFDPTFHRYRLNEYADKQGRTIFVCSMADLFGEWVPDEWIDEVLKSCFRAPQHRYLFLTKNPDRYDEYFSDDNGHYQKHVSQYYPNGWRTTKNHIMLGATVANNKDLLKCYETVYADFLSIEPLLEEIECETLFSISTPYSGGTEIKKYEWVIIGAETGNRKDKVTPKREWIESIVEECRAYDIPVFMKNSLASIWGEPLIQNLPWANS